MKFFANIEVHCFCSIHFDMFHAVNHKIFRILYSASIFNEAYGFIKSQRLPIIFRNATKNRLDFFMHELAESEMHIDQLH